MLTYARWKYIVTDAPAGVVEELYDLENDPFELQNLANVPRFAPVLEQMREALGEWEKETDDKVPKHRRDDGFDRETGERLKPKRKAGKKKKAAK